jgi:hypothetical protein
MRRLIWLAALPCLFLSTSLLGQSRPVELGLDLGIEFDITDDPGPNRTVIALPAQRLRVGLFASQQFSIEPSVSFSLVDVSDVSLIEGSLNLLLAYHFTADRERPRVYLQAGGGLNLIDFEDESDAQFRVGGGLGVKIPAGDRFAVRLEADYFRSFESDLRYGTNTILGLIGFSFFTS